MGILLDHRLIVLPGCLARFLVDLGVPLVNPRQQLLKARQERCEPFGVPAFSFAGVVVGHERRRLLQVVPSGPADYKRWIADGLAVGVADPAFLGHVELATQPPVVGLLEVCRGVLGRHRDFGIVRDGHTLKVLGLVFRITFTFLSDLHVSYMLPVRYILSLVSSEISWRTAASLSGCYWRRRFQIPTPSLFRSSFPQT